MARDPVILFAVLSLYVLIAWLIIHRILIRTRLVGHLKCKFGRHQYVSLELGEIIKHHRCVFCNDAKHNLKVLSGGKKNLEDKFKF